MSPGWHSNTLQIVSGLLNLMAFALPVFRIERFDKVNPTWSESSLSDIFRLAINVYIYYNCPNLNRQIIFRSKVNGIP